ncbi:conserved hypothetical protein [Luminiphilus syltensis NOR5-1B]|uniref:Glycine zipper 2TM domain-containing protein n=1 Tax=Luminiphilus syltensis NOR5-1B TaxID=565045 RepID=B8KRD6_9GAMM|nr:hypothetical protein [Luminiphilus syltensis]EED36817.1 conserved hypothetical protein [Luminiphilus syltensis NOR5-1B]
MKLKLIRLSPVLLLLLAVGVNAQRAGQSMSIQHGVVTASRMVDLNSGAVPKGALVGGSLGLISAKGKKSSKKTRNALVGAIAGGAVAKGAQGDTRGMMYEVKLGGAAGAVQVVTDQREIRIGDCVAVERAGDTANVRRVSSAYCEQANEAAVAAVADESAEEADECYLAKTAVVEAATIEEAELAAMKMKLLCDD